VLKGDGDGSETVHGDLVNARDGLEETLEKKRGRGGGKMRKREWSTLVASRRSV